MQTCDLSVVRRLGLALGVLALSTSFAAAQESKSAPVFDLTPTLPSLSQFAQNSTDVPQYSSSQVASVAPELMDFSASLGKDQPPPRRQYGRPRYNDSGHNPDGSNKWAFMVGGGFNNPVGATGHYQTVGWKLAVGGGRNFNRYFGLLAQFDYDRMNIPGSILNTMIAAYQAAGYNASGLDGNTHLWSLTLNPTITFMQNDVSSAYVVGGGGFYRKVTNFTLPTTGYYCDYYGFCYQVTSNQTFDSYSNNAGGVNIGLGFTRKISRFSNQKLFAEARYTWVNNSKDPNAYYSPNGFRTSYIPVTVGLRW